MHARHRIKLLGLAVLAAIGVMAVSASAAQAKYLLLLNGKSVSSLYFALEILSTSVKAENGLKVECSGGKGSSKATLSGSAEKLTGNPSAIFTGCKWVGNEKTCTINDGGAGNIELIGNDDMVMPKAEEYRLTDTNAQFGTIYTEGVFCTIPEEEVLSGTASATILDALKDTTVKLAHFNADDLKIGNSKVTELVSEMHVTDASNPTATFGIHLVNL